MAPLFAVIVIIFILVLSISLFASIMDTNRTPDKIGSGAILVLVVIEFTLLLIILFEPSAMDVYQGKTTLEVTYKENVPIDSVVVWK